MRTPILLRGWPACTCPRRRRPTPPGLSQITAASGRDASVSSSQAPPRCNPRALVSGLDTLEVQCRGSPIRYLHDSAPGISRKPSRTLRSEEHTSELQSLTNLVCRLLLE